MSRFNYQVTRLRDDFSEVKTGRWLRAESQMDVLRDYAIDCHSTKTEREETAMYVVTLWWNKYGYNLGEKPIDTWVFTKALTPLLPFEVPEVYDAYA